MLFPLYVDMIRPCCGGPSVLEPWSPEVTPPSPATRSDRSHTGALVLGGNYRALGVVRSLGRRGIPVRIVKHDDARIATLSRYAGRSLGWTPGDQRAQIEHLLALAARHGLEGWTLIPTDDESAVL